MPFPADFSRLILDLGEDHPTSITRVLFQQGRPLSDRDLNEQVDLHVRSLRRALADVIGPYGGRDLAWKEGAFAITATVTTLGDGRKRINFTWDRQEVGAYYVDGLRCLPGGDVVGPSEADVVADFYVVYLEAWERTVTSEEDPGPHEPSQGWGAAIRDPALCGLDTAARSVVTCRIRAYPYPRQGTALAPLITRMVEIRREPWILNASPSLDALPICVRVSRETAKQDGCSVPGRRRGSIENLLYRVEIHAVGLSDSASPPKQHVTVKWSRHNGASTFGMMGKPVKEENGKGWVVELRRLEAEGPLSLHPGDLVEVLHDESWKDEEPAKLIEVVHVNVAHRTVTLAQEPPPPHRAQPTRREKAAPFLRRWDHGCQPPAGFEVKDHAIVVPSATEEWLPLEGGLEIRIPEVDTTKYINYLPGHCWLIPTRRDLDGILPDTAEHFDPTSGCWSVPQQVRRVYAPLAEVKLAEAGDDHEYQDVRLTFLPLGKDIEAPPTMKKTEGFPGLGATSGGQTTAKEAKPRKKGSKAAADAKADGAKPADPPTPADPPKE